jgi:hypothetical protein
VAKKSHKNSKHLADLIDSATVPAIRLLAQVDKFAMLGGTDTSLPEDQARAALREYILTVKREEVTIADQEAVRLLQLVRFRTEEMLEHAYRELEFEQHVEIATYDRSADAMTRLIWLNVKASHVFDQIETIYLTHHFHGHKKFLGFTVRDGDGRDFQWTPEVEKRLHEGVGEILELDDEAKQNCELIHFEMDEGDADAQRRVHYLVVYHPGKMKLLRQLQRAGAVITSLLDDSVPHSVSAKVARQKHASQVMDDLLESTSSALPTVEVGDLSEEQCDRDARNECKIPLPLNVGMRPTK